MGMIRPWLALLMIRVLLTAASVGPAQASVVVVTESGVPAYADALAGLTAGLGSTGIRVVDIRATGAPADLTRALESREVRVAVAIGSRAFAELQTRKPALPIVAAMMLRGTAADAAGQLNLDLPLSVQLGALRSLLPHATRVGIIRNPARTHLSSEALESQGRKEGYSLVIEDCDSPARLLKAVAALKGRIDVLLCFPDPDLYNSVTVQPLVMAAIEYRLPIVGFSPALVHAGAAAGIYPDYRSMGRQAADIANRLHHGDPAGPEEFPAKLQISVNQRVVRLLGLDLHLPPGVEVFR